MTDIPVAEPTVEPISLTAAKLHLRETASGQDALISSIIKAAREHAETYTRRALVLQRRRLQIDYFPACIEIPRGPLRALLSIKYLDTSAALQTLSASLYRVDKESNRARVTPAYGEVWPSTHPVTNAVQVEYTCGHLIPVTADANTDVLTSDQEHGFADDDQTMIETVGGTLPTGLAANTNYFVRDVAAKTLKLAATSGGAAIDITAAGSAPNVLGKLPEPMRHALNILVQYFERRDADADLLKAAELLLQPYRVVRF